MIRRIRQSFYLSCSLPRGVTAPLPPALARRTNSVILIRGSYAAFHLVCFVVDLKGYLESSLAKIGLWRFVDYFLRVLFISTYCTYIYLLPQYHFNRPWLQGLMRILGRPGVCSNSVVQSIRLYSTLAESNLRGASPSLL